MMSFKYPVFAVLLAFSTPVLAQSKLPLVPGMTGTLNIPTLDLSQGGGSDGGSPKAPREPGKVFQADPLPWNQLSAANTDVTFNIGQVALGNGVMLTNVVLPVKMGGGKLVANGITGKLLGGTLSGSVTLSQADKRVTLKANARGLSAERLAKELGITGINKGPLDLSIDVRGAGDSVRAIMASLDGSVIAGMGEGRVHNDALTALGADIVVQILNAVGGGNPETVARCVVANVQIRNGIAATEQGIAMVTDKMDAVATGEIDLAQEQIALAVSPRAKSGFAAGLGDLSQSLRVVGPLANPRVQLDSDGVMKALGAALNGNTAEPVAMGDICATARTWHQNR